MAVVGVEALEVEEGWVGGCKIEDGGQGGFEFGGGELDAGAVVACI